MQRLLLLTLAVVSLASALEDPTEKLNSITHEADAKRVAYIKGWLAEANLEPIPEPAKAPKSIQAEDALRKLRQTNTALALARSTMATGGTLEYLKLASPAMFGPILEAEALRKAAPAGSADHR